MKAWLTAILIVVTFQANADDQVGWHRKAPDKPKRHNPKLDQKSPAYDNLFTNTIDPAKFLKDIPPQFIGLKNVEALSDVDISTYGGYPAQTYIKVVIPGFIYPEKITAMGVIIGGIEAEYMMEEDNIAIMKTNGKAQLGKVYTVLRPGHRKKDATGEKWFHYTAAGTVTLKKLEKDNKALVVVSRDHFVKVGDLVVPFINLERKLEMNSAKRKHFPAKARIAALADVDTEFTGEGGIVFLDRGSNSGLGPNQILDVYADPKYRKLDSSSPRLIGKVLIVDTTPFSSAAMILSSSMELIIGDFATSMIK